jgi:hypothetical protein
LRASEDVFALTEIVPGVQGAAAFPPPSVDQNGLRRLPALLLPPIEEDGDDGAVREPMLKGTVQLGLVPRHDQQIQDRRFGRCNRRAFGLDWHCFPPHG